MCTNVMAHSNSGKPNTPKTTKVGSWSVLISITPPAGADTSKVIIYLIKCRKVGDSACHSVPETNSTSVTVSKLYSYMRSQSQQSTREERNQTKCLVNAGLKMTYIVRHTHHTHRTYSYPYFIRQEAQLPQRNSASVAHMEGDKPSSPPPSGYTYA